MRLHGRAAVLAASLVWNHLHAPATAAPAGLAFKEAALRGLLPPDGTLIEQGEISIEYLGFALGREVRARGKRVYVSDRPIGERGLVFRDGYVELNIGAHAEKEERIGFLKPTFAVDMGARAKLHLDDQLNVRVELEWMYIEGDNLGGKIIVEFAKNKIREVAEREVKAFAGRLGEKLRKKVLAGLRGFTLRIGPGQLVLVPKAGR